LAVIVFGSNALQARGQRGLAFILAAVLAVPVFLACLFFALLLVSGVRWN
jgi:arginine exporter protein ArgO